MVMFQKCNVLKSDFLISISLNSDCIIIYLLSLYYYLILILAQLQHKHFV